MIDITHTSRITTNTISSSSELPRLLAQRLTSLPRISVVHKQGWGPFRFEEVESEFISVKSCTVKSLKNMNNKPYNEAIGGFGGTDWPMSPRRVNRLIARAIAWTKQDGDLQRLKPCIAPTIANLKSSKPRVSSSAIANLIQLAELGVINLDQPAHQPLKQHIASELFTSPVSRSGGKSV